MAAWRDVTRNKLATALQSMRPQWRSLLKTTAVQLGVGGFGALLMVLISVQAAGAYLFGVCLVASSTVFSARFALRKTTSPIASVAAVLSAIAWKWLWVFAGLYLAFARWQLPGLALILGILTALLVPIAVGMRR
jgi:hypothetical protein